MLNIPKIVLNQQQNIQNNAVVIWRLTALWAFCEAALGGILHAFKIPLTGLFVGASAIIFISQIAYFSNDRSEILKITFKVILVKFVASPYSPLAAYFAVLLQGILGYLLFYRGYNKISPIILGFLSLLFSSIQKIIILTVLFGLTLWESIDIFFEFVYSQIFSGSSEQIGFSLSYLLVGVYIFIHITGGILAGIYAASLPRIIEFELDNEKRKEIVNNSMLNAKIGRNKLKKKWWRRPIYIILFIFSIGLIILSYTLESLDNTLAEKVLFMLVRSILILLIWFYFVSPILLRFTKKFLAKKQKEQSEEIENIINLFPNIRTLVRISWRESLDNGKGIKIIRFINYIIVNFLLLEYKPNE